jgi:hypothetical protein
MNYLRSILLFKNYYLFLYGNFGLGDTFLKIRNKDNYTVFDYNFHENKYFSEILIPFEKQGFVLFIFYDLKLKKNVYFQIDFNLEEIVIHKIFNLFSLNLVQLKLPWLFKGDSALGIEIIAEKKVQFIKLDLDYPNFLTQALVSFNNVDEGLVFEYLDLKEAIFILFSIDGGLCLCKIDLKSGNVKTRNILFDKQRILPLKVIIVQNKIFAYARTLSVEDDNSIFKSEDLMGDFDSIEFEEIESEILTLTINWRNPSLVSFKRSGEKDIGFYSINFDGFFERKGHIIGINEVFWISSRKLIIPSHNNISILELENFKEIFSSGILIIDPFGKFPPNHFFPPFNYFQNNLEYLGHYCSQKMKNSESDVFSNLIIGLKKNKKYAIDFFVTKLKETLGNWFTLVVIPSHDPEKTDSGVKKVAVELCKSNPTIDDGTDLLIRFKKIEKLSFGGYRNYSVIYDSLKVNDSTRIKDKNIILLDDVSTTGVSLLAGKDQLIANGAKWVFCFSLGKTVKVDKIE